MNARRARFVREYLIDLNATRAAIRAGYSPATAGQAGDRLLKNVEVSAAIAAAEQARAERVGIEADRVLEELAAVGFAKLSEVAEWDDERFSLKPSSEIDARPVLEVKQKRRVLVTEEGEQILSEERGIKLHDKIQALKLLGQHLGMFRESGLPEGGLKVIVEYADRPPDPAETP